MRSNPAGHGSAPDSRDGGLDAMLVAMCVAVPVVALAIVWFGGPA